MASLVNVAHFFLSSLRLGNSELTLACCDKLASIIVAKQCLEELDLSNNMLEDEGVRKLCEAVRNPNCQLKLLMYVVPT